MSIKSPATYGDWYWKNSVEATEAFDEQIESAFAPHFKAVLNDLLPVEDMPNSMGVLLSSLAEPPSAGFGGFALGVGVEMIDETLHSLMAPMMKMMSRSVNRKALETWLTTQQAGILLSRRRITANYFNIIAASEGYADIIGEGVYESGLPYPSPADFVLYARYHGSPDDTKSIVSEWYGLLDRDYKVWDWLGKQRLNTMQAQTLFRRGLIGEGGLVAELAKIGWSGEDRDKVKELGWSIPNAMLLVQGNLMKNASPTTIMHDITKADIHPQYTEKYLDAVLTKPSTQDIINYMLRKDPKLGNLDRELKRIGVHPEYFKLYKELGKRIPPLSDIISMSVREAFSPAIAGRFGQYEDFPAEMKEWGEKIGYDVEWSKRYWAAHWSLPSPQQGFEMLHRGAIGEGDLNMLLRALDIMPFWRDKLIRIAYRRVTRVDIRRMYKAGVITAGDVYEANKELGYNDRDARRMTDFTVQWALGKHNSITRTDILTAYKSRMIPRSEASQLLENLGEEYFHREFMLEAVDYKKDLEITELQIKGINNLYKRRTYDENKARDELLKLDLPSEEVDLLMQQWYYEVKAEPKRNWTTAQVLNFVKDGLITLERGREELVHIGYDNEHIDIYMKAIK